jgi:hypothetical protein
MASLFSQSDAMNCDARLVSECTEECIEIAPGRDC